MPNELETIVQRMIEANESEENIAAVIQSYQPQGPKGDTSTEPGTFMGGFTKHLLTKEPGTLAAIASDSAADSMRRSSSRSHCTAAPAMKTEPSRA